MARFGEELQQAREAQGVSLEEISELTKVSVRHLRALETEDFRDLPGGVFNKGIVRGYARYLGLEEEPWIERFMESYRRSAALKEDDANWLAFSESVSNETVANKPGRRLRWVGVGAMLAVLALLGWGVWALARVKLH